MEDSVPVYALIVIPSNTASYSYLKSLAGGTTAVSCAVLSSVLELFPVSGTETFAEFVVDLLSGLKSLAGGTTAVSCVVLSFVLELFPVSGTETFVELVVDLLSGDADAVGAVILLLH